MRVVNHHKLRLAYAAAWNILIGNLNLESLIFFKAICQFIFKHIWLTADDVDNLGRLDIDTLGDALQECLFLDLAQMLHVLHLLKLFPLGCFLVSENTCIELLS